MLRILKEQWFNIVLILVSYVLMVVAIGSHDYGIGTIALMAMLNVK